MPEFTDLKELLNHIADFSRERLLEKGELIPTIYVVTRKNRLIVLGFTNFPAETKQKAGLLARVGLSVAKNLEKGDAVKFFALLTEGWVVTALATEYDRSIVPSEHPNRIEAVVIFGHMDAENESFLHTLRIIRNEDGAPVEVADDMNIQHQPDKVVSPLIEAFLLGLKLGTHNLENLS